MTVSDIVARTAARIPQNPLAASQSYEKLRYAEELPDGEALEAMDQLLSLLQQSWSK